MTVPTPPPHNPDPSQPYPTAPTPASPFAVQPEHGVGGYGSPDVNVGHEFRDGALCALAVTVVGLVLGALWLWLAPHVPLFTDGKAVYLKDPEGEEAIGAEGTFALLGLAVGAVAGALVFLTRKRGGIGLVVGLMIGGVLGSLVAWRFGVWLGPETDVVAAAKEAGRNATFDAPLKLQAKGVLLAMPVAALLVHVLCTALFGPRDPDPVAPPVEW